MSDAQCADVQENVPGDATLRSTYILVSTAGNHVVFGMDWTPLVGGNPRTLATRRARSLRATHYLVAGPHASSLGCLRLLQKHYRKRKVIYSAAAVFASNHPAGAVACLMPVPGQGCWMVATHGGAVLSQTDKWFADEQSARAALDSVRSRFPNMSIHVEPAGAGACQPCPAWLDGPISITSALQPLRLRGTDPGTWLKALTAGVAVGIGVYLLPASRSVDHVAQTPDPDTQWRETLQAFARIHPVHSFQDLSQMMQHWRHVPVDPSGWRLRQIRCEPAGLDWQCSADYMRQHRLALHAHLERVKPSGWMLHFTPLDGAAMSWRVLQAGSFLDWTATPRMVDWMSHFQRIHPAFEHIQIGAGTKLSISAPLDAQGQPLSRPENMPLWGLRTLIVKGPLRSVPALAALDVPIRWRSASLAIERTPGQGIAHSPLLVQLVGDLFEHRP